MNDKKEALLAALQEKSALLDQIYTLTQEQAALLEEEDTDRLMTNIDRRQLLIDRAEALGTADGDMADFGIAALRETVRARLRDILALDERNRLAARQLSDRFKAEVKKLSDGRKTLSVYNQGSALFGTEYFDKHS